MTETMITTEQSPSIVKLAAAFAKAQAKFTSIEKDRTNPHFNSRYATLDACLDMVRAPLAEHGLCVLQFCANVQQDHAHVYSLDVRTRLQHESGEYLENRVTMPVLPPSRKRRDGEEEVQSHAIPTPQQIGSALTYGRRYGLSLLLGLSADEDDDGNAASPEGARGKEDTTPVLDRKLPFKWGDRAARTWALRDIPLAELRKVARWMKEKGAFADFLPALEEAGRMKVAVTDYYQRRDQPAPAEVTDEMVALALAEQAPPAESA